MDFREEVEKLFKFEVLDHMVGLEGKTVLYTEENYPLSYDEANIILAQDEDGKKYVFSYYASGYGEGYAEIEYHTSRELRDIIARSRNLPSFFTRNDLISEERYNKLYEENERIKREESDKKSKEREYKQYLALKKKYEE